MLALDTHRPSCQNQDMDILPYMKNKLHLQESSDCFDRLYHTLRDTFLEGIPGKQILEDVYSFSFECHKTLLDNACSL